MLTAFGPAVAGEAPVEMDAAVGLAPEGLAPERLARC